MLSVFRKTRKRLLQENRFTRYLVYAAGETVLIVVGILLALEINNWNEAKNDQQAITGYLTTIARNLESDLYELKEIRQTRAYALSRSPYYSELSLSDRRLMVDDIFYLSETFQEVVNLKSLVINTSGYESLKFSGYLSKIQGTDIESLIYDYYGLAEQIRAKESQHNSILRDSYSSFLNINLPELFSMQFPNVITQEILDAQQDAYKNLLRENSIANAFNHVANNNLNLIILYDNLIILAETLRDVIQQGRMELDDSQRQALSLRYNKNSDKGYPDVIVNGGANNDLFAVGNALADGRNELYWQTSELNELVHDFPGNPWGVRFYTIKNDTLESRPTRDYSGFQYLDLELKALTNGQTVYILIKDDLDPDDGSETQIPLTLTTEWNTYRIPLSDFKTADLTRLFLVVGFLYLGEPQTISIKNVRYVR